MYSYIIRRLGALILTLIIVSFVVSSMIRFIPGNPITLMFGRQVSPEKAEKYRKRLGLDRSVVVQYWDWLKGLFHGDLGQSIFSDVRVTELIKTRYPRTIGLVIFGMMVALIIGLGGGIAAAVYRNSWIDIFVSSGTIVGISLPKFWLGLILILILGFNVKWLPAVGYASLKEGFVNYLRHLILPSIALGMATGSTIARITRSSLLEVLQEQYIDTARAKGSPEISVIFRHALRNALIPVVTVSSIQIGYMMGGSAVVEKLFTYPGVGHLIVDAIMSRDYTVVQGAIFMYAATFGVINLSTDILYSLLNPKIRYS